MAASLAGGCDGRPAGDTICLTVWVRQPEFHFGNYEQVAAPVDGAKILATRPEMAAMALDYGHHRLSVQFHPEADCNVFAGAWSDSHPDFVKNYYELPEAPKMLRNFLKGSGLI